MNPNITVKEVMLKEKILRSNLQKLLIDFKDETGFYVEGIYLNYFDSFAEKNHALEIEFSTRINT